MNGAVRSDQRVCESVKRVKEGGRKRIEERGQGRM